MAEYGMPYMGSKRGICNELIKRIPKAQHFYDLFGGGFAVTHAMFLRRSHHFKEFHFNELRPGIVELIQDAIAAKYNYDVFLPEFIDRETFFRRKDFDAYVKMVWSFGNDGNNYLFPKEIEPYKRSMHNAIVFNQLDDLAQQVLGMERFKDGFSIQDRRLFLRNKIEQFRIRGIPEFLIPFLNEKQLERLQRLQQLQQLQQLLQLQQLERLQRLEQLERLQRLERLERLHFYNLSYDQVPIKDNSVIYCDPPYLGTAEYDKVFDHKKFYDWADAQRNPVFISEYQMPKDRFTQLWSITKRSMLGGARENKVERLFVNKAGVEFLKRYPRK